MLRDSESCFSFLLFSPFVTVEGEGFRKVIAKAVWIGSKYGNIDIEEDLPVATTVARHLGGIATSHRQILATELRKVPRIAITSDMWTHEGTNAPYITITAHFINNDWELRGEVRHY